MVLNQIQVRFFCSVTSVYTVISDFMQLLHHFRMTFTTILCGRMAILSCGQALTGVVRSNPWHPEILDEICFCEVIHITIPPLLALTLHLHTPSYRNNSHCATTSHKKICLSFSSSSSSLSSAHECCFQASMFTSVWQHAACDIFVIALLRMWVSSGLRPVHTGIWCWPYFKK